MPAVKSDQDKQQQALTEFVAEVLQLAVERELDMPAAAAGLRAGAHLLEMVEAQPALSDRELEALYPLVVDGEMVLQAHNRRLT